MSLYIEGGGLLDDFNVAMTLHLEYKQVSCKKNKLQTTKSLTHALSHELLLKWCFVCFENHLHALSECRKTTISFQIKAHQSMLLALTNHTVNGHSPERFFCWSVRRNTSVISTPLHGEGLSLLIASNTNE